MPSLRTLHPAFRPYAEAFFQYARTRAPGLTVTSARRSYREQSRLYRASRAGRNDGLPAVPPGTSDHEVGFAFDMARPGRDPFTDQELHELGYAWSTSYGGRWSARDPVHFAAPATWLRKASGAGRRKRRGRH